MKIAEEFGFKAVEEFAKEELARSVEEEKKIKRFRKEKKEREEKARGYRGFRGGRSGFRGFGDSRHEYESRRGWDGSYKDRRFDGAATSLMFSRTSRATAVRSLVTWSGTASSLMYLRVGSEGE